MAKITGTWAFSRGQEELQTRLKKLHEEKDLIVNLLDHMIDRMNVIVNHTAAITNINQFLRHFYDATGTMERFFHKLFQIHVLLTEEDYIDTSMRGPQMSIAYSIHEDKTNNTTSSLAVLTADGDYRCLHSSSSVPADQLPLQGCEGELSPLHPEPTPMATLPRTSVAPNATHLITHATAVATAPAYIAPTGVPSTQMAPLSFTQTLTTATNPLLSGAVVPPGSPSVSPAAAITASTATTQETAREGDMIMRSPLQAAIATKPSSAAAAAAFGEQKAKVADGKRGSCYPDPQQNAVALKVDRSTFLPQGAGDSAARKRDKSVTEDESGDPCTQQVNFPRVPRTLPKYGARPAAHEGGAASSTKGPSSNMPPEGVSIPTTSAAPIIIIPPPVVEVTGKPVDVVLSSYKSPNEFWLQQKSSSDTLQMLLESLHGLYNARAPDPSFEIKVGMYCAAYYAADTYWYRAKVLQVQQGHVKVAYIDFGNRERVEKHNVHPLDSSLAAIPAQALCCSIRGIKPIGEQVMWDHQAVQTFNQKLNGDVSLRAIFYEHDPIKCRYAIEVLVDSNGPEDRVTLNLAEHFVSLRLAEEVDCPDDIVPLCGATSSRSLPPKAPFQSSHVLPQTLVPSATSTAPALASIAPSAHVPPPVLPEGDFLVTLSVVFNPSDFYGQVMDDVAKQQELEGLQQRLNEYGPQSQSPAQNEVVPGSHWVCLYSGDKHWYRVRVLDVVQEPIQLKFKVFYVDYGNRGTVTVAELRPLTAELAELPAFAHHLALSLVVPIGDRWNETAKQLFVEKTGFDEPLYAEHKKQRKDALGVVTEVVLWSQKAPRTGVNLNILLVEHNVAVIKHESAVP